ncbi:phage tail assembly chaperone [Stakelama sp. CBK3Z-3]|uniref:Phage tail assembly chaperone n=1 Tax=Stakelama flava TaxID=2860338 RepID=A0ABS6XK49_9SPHN|nr:phage tail assembly chaperone [Stakelama flava]
MSERFAPAAGRLAGAAGLWLGWPPHAFWQATPAELAAVMQAARGDAPQPADRETLTRMMEADGDG